MILEIKEETLQTAIEVAFNGLINGSSGYNNPIKSLIEKQIGSSYSKGELTDEINKRITIKINEIMDRPEFSTFLGQAVANAIANREIDKQKK